MTTHDVPVRSARNRLIDLLGFGDTYPITDLNVVADQLKVPFGGTARIPIEHAQEGVTYELCDPKGQPLGAAFKGDGHGGTLVIDTPRVMADVTYRIRATKQPSRSDLPPQPPIFLDERAPVKVGLDTGLVIEITDAWLPGQAEPAPAPLLDPANAHPRPSDPRLVPFGASVDVRINNSQEGVQYSLLIDSEEMKEPVLTGDLAAIVLRTRPIQEDAVIRVRATKTFQAAENRTAETMLLDAKLYLKVKANQTLAVSAAASILGYGEDATIQIAATQRSVMYRAYAQSIPDRDFVHGDTTEKDLVIVPVAGKPNVQVRLEPPSETWSTPDGYRPLGDAPVAGTGKALAFTLKGLSDDAIILIQANKDHQIDAARPEAGSIPSAVRLLQPAVVLVRPDPARVLTLRVPVAEGKTGDTMQVADGQPGVFYYFRPSPAGDEFPLPAYFHKRDDRDPSQNKGVEQLGLEVDFAVARDPESRPDALALPSTSPRAPLVSITPVAVDTSLAIRAVKAQTSVEVPLTEAARIRPIPDIGAKPSVANYGAPTRIVILASRADDLYQVSRAGVPLAPAQPGTGSDLLVDTEPIVADTTFEVLVTSPSVRGMRVDRTGSVGVRVAPMVTLPVAPRAESVAKDAATEIVVQETQAGVNYQLMVDNTNTAVGPAVPGNGASIALPTGAISVNISFMVVASRADDAGIMSTLTARATVTIAPGP